MSDYRRVYLQGGVYFFTVNLRERTSDTLVRKFDLLLLAVRQVKKSKPFSIMAWVILPDHIHMIWRLPEGDDQYSSRWRAIKTLFCKKSGNHGNIYTNIWQPRFWEHAIQSEEDLQNHINYIHINPLKHGYVDRVVDWPFSSFHSFFDKGVYSESWGTGFEVPSDSNFGE